MRRPSGFAKAALFLALFPLGARADAPATSVAAAESFVAVKRGDLKLDVKCDGWFEAVAPIEVRLRPRAYQGELKIVSIAPQGVAVKKGDVILKLDTDEIERQIAAAGNELKTATAALAKAEADVKLGEEADKIAMTVQTQAEKAAADAVEWWEKVDGPHMLKQFERQVKFARINVEDQTDELDQLKKMYKSEDLTNATADIVVKRAVRALEIANESLSLAQQQAEKNKATQYETSRQAVANALAQQKNATESLKAAQAQAKVQREAALFSARQAHQAAQRRLENLQEDLSSMTVAAYSDGVVLYGKFSQGNWQGNNVTYSPRDKVQPEQVVLTLVEPGKVRLIAPVPEDKIARVAVGQTAVVTPRALPELATNGKVTAVPAAPTIGGEPAKFEVVITPDKTDPRFLPGYRASITIDIDDATGVLAIDSKAISGGKVMVKAGDKVEEREIVTGRSNGEQVEVIRGLGEGEQVMATYKKE